MNASCAAQLSSAETHSIARHSVQDAEPIAELPEVLPFKLTKKQYKNYRHRLFQRHPHCTYCGVKLASDKATLDHIVPSCEGGEDTPSNLALACERCNGVKADRSVTEWAVDIIAATVAIDSVEIWLAGSVPYRSREIAQAAADAIQSAGNDRPAVLVASIPLAMFQEGSEA